MRWKIKVKIKYFDFFFNIIIIRYWLVLLRLSVKRNYKLIWHSICSINLAEIISGAVTFEKTNSSTMPLMFVDRLRHRVDVVWQQIRIIWLAQHVRIFKKNVDSVISINLVTSLYLRNLYSFKLLVLVTAAVQKKDWIKLY